MKIVEKVRALKRIDVNDRMRYITTSAKAHQAHRLASHTNRKATKAAQDEKMAEKKALSGQTKAEKKVEAYNAIMELKYLTLTLTLTLTGGL